MPIKIHGKDYATVNERLLEMHSKYPKCSVVTEVLECTDEKVLIRATITPEATRPQQIFTGHAYERQDSGKINKTSHVENCETSAIGRALASMGVQIEGGFASADEVQMAVAQQEASKKNPPSPKATPKPKKPKRPQPEDPANKGQINQIVELLEWMHISKDDWTDYLNTGLEEINQGVIKSAKDLTNAQALELICWLDNRYTEMKEAGKDVCDALR